MWTCAGSAPWSYFVPYQFARQITYWELLHKLDQVTVLGNDGVLRNTDSECEDVLSQ